MVYAHWNIQKYILNVEKFVKSDLKLPSILQDPASTVKMLTLLFPTTTRKRIPNLSQEVDRNFFASAFRENNVQIRLKFFSDPLIKYLWSKIFIVESPETMVAHLRRIRSHEDLGEAKQERFLKDIKGHELKLNIKMLPDIANNPENLHVFTKEEKLADLQDISKFYKKDSLHRKIVQYHHIACDTSPALKWFDYKPHYPYHFQKELPDFSLRAST